jgi:hypothetical protein
VRGVGTSVAVVEDRHRISPLSLVPRLPSWNAGAVGVARRRVPTNIVADNVRAFDLRSVS